MSLETYVVRVRRAIEAEIASTHAEMDKGKSPDEYMKLVGRNQQNRKVLDILREQLEGLGAEIEDEDGSLEELDP